MSAWAIKW